MEDGRGWFIGESNKNDADKDAQSKSRRDTERVYVPSRPLRPGCNHGSQYYGGSTRQVYVCSHPMRWTPSYTVLRKRLEQLRPSTHAPSSRSDFHW